MKRVFFWSIAIMFLILSVIAPTRYAEAWTAKWTLFLPYSVDQTHWWTGINIQSTVSTSHFNIQFYNGAALYASRNDWAVSGGAWTGLAESLLPTGSTFQNRTMMTLESDNPFTVTQFIGNTDNTSSQGFGYQTFYAYPKVGSDSWPNKPDRSTAGTCITSLPYTISSPGLYYLVEDLTSTSTSSNGIHVNANNVTIDLNGFSIIGPGKDISATLCGIYTGGREGLEVKNGTIREFPSNGIYEWEDAGKNHRFLNLRVTNNGYAGIAVHGNGHLIKDCTVSNNDVDGIYITDSGGTITGNICNGNGGNGIQSGDGMTITGNTACNNQLNGITASEYCLVDGNTCYNNGLAGHGHNMDSCPTCQFGINVAP